MTSGAMTVFHTTSVAVSLICIVAFPETVSFFYAERFAETAYYCDCRV